MAQAKLESPERGASLALDRARSAWSPGIVTLTGELDLATAPHAARLLREAREHVVVVDLRGLEFMDIVGLHVILDASTQARRDGRRVVVVCGPANVDMVFALTATDELIELVALEASELPERAVERLRPRRVAHARERPSLSIASPSPADTYMGASMRHVEHELEARFEVLSPTSR